MGTGIQPGKSSTQNFDSELPRGEVGARAVVLAGLNMR
jgi:hypothetical protein